MSLSNNNKCLVTFLSTQHLLQAEDLLKADNLKAKIISVPAYLITSCNKALEFDCYWSQKVDTIFHENGIMVEKFHNSIPGEAGLIDKLREVTL